MADRFFAFLRAINTGNRRLTNEQLLAPFVELGFIEVAAYQAAGNITFLSDDADAVEEDRIERALADAYGFDAPTFVRSAAEVGAIGRIAAFSSERMASTAGKVQVSFLRREPTPEQLSVLDGLVPEQDFVRVIGREWYWLPVEGVSTSKLPVGEIEKLLGAMTMRTLGTLERMFARFGA